MVRVGQASAMFLQARMAGERGASAVLFDITEDRSAAEQVPGDPGRVWLEEGRVRGVEAEVTTALWGLVLCSCSSP